MKLKGPAEVKAFDLCGPLWEYSWWAHRGIGGLTRACARSAPIVQYREVKHGPLLRIAMRYDTDMVAVLTCEASGLKHAFVIVQTNRFGQILGVYTLQASSESLKASVFSLFTMQLSRLHI